MAYIDFGSIAGGMSDTVKAIGAISDLGQIKDKNQVTDFQEIKSLKT